MEPIRILVVDSRALIRKGVSVLLSGVPDLRVIGQAQSIQEALQFMRLQATDVVVIDVELPGRPSGAEAVAAIRGAFRSARIVVLTNLQDATTIHASLRAGAISYLLKNISIEELGDSIRAAYRGVPTLSTEVTGVLVQHAVVPAHSMHDLTDREQQVLELMSRGLNNQQIATELSISLSTVQFHVSNILAKLGARNRTEAAAFAVRRRFGGG